MTHLSISHPILTKTLARWAVTPLIAIALCGFAGVAGADTIQGTVASTAPSVQPALCVTLTHSLALRSRDAVTSGEVTSLQNFLAAQGYFHVTSTGYFGSITMDAVTQFQRANGVSAIGVVGPMTRAAIVRVGCGTVSQSPVTIYSISPVAGPLGTTVSVTGFGFTSDNTIRFGNGALVHVPITSSIAIACTTDPSCHGGINQTLTFTVPSTLNPLCYYSGCMMASVQTTPGAYAVSVENTNGTSNAKTFTVTSGTASATPSISSVSPSSAAVGTMITLYGSGFTANQYVMIGGGTLKASSVSADGTQLTFTLPDSVGPYCAPGMMCAMYMRLLTPGSYTLSVIDESTSAMSNSVSFTIIGGSSSQAPTIRGIDAPSVLAIGTSGTWTVHAIVPANSNGNLHYSVVWGDEQQAAASGASSIMMPVPSSTEASATFTHAYHISGTYTPLFTVTNDSGQSTQVSSTITVTPLY
jgi:peptidoglycan hydrolase-like protein with peptidoglycan-binding domain